MAATAVERDPPGRGWSLAPALIASLALIYKAIWLALNAVPFNGDEGIVALMARHILQGERPVFFYGQAYLGSTDAWLIAFSFSLFGQSVLAIRLVQLVLFIGTLITSYHVARRFGLADWSSTVAMLLLALPPTMLTLYTTATLGGYGETLLLGNVLLLMADSGWLITNHSWLSVSRYFLFGLVAGVGFYTFPLILIYLFPIGLWLLFQRHWVTWRGYAIGLVGFAIGAAPWWIALIQSGGALIAELTGSAVAGSISGSLGVRLVDFFVFGVSALFGLRYPWSADFVLPFAGVFVAIIYLGAFVYAFKHSSKILSRQKLWIIPWGMLSVLLITFLFTPFGGDPSGRYFLPLYLPLSIFTALLLEWLHEKNRTLVVLSLVLILGYNVIGTLNAAAIQPPGISTQFDPVTWIDHTRDQELIDFLLAHHETRGYTNYWVQTPIAFLSNEKIISSAQLPYHLDLDYTPRDDRYPPYTKMVAQADRAFYITTNHPPLDDLIRGGLSRLNVTFTEQDIGNYHIFYGLSRKVTPNELQLHQ